MAGDISTREHTFLWLVSDHLTRTNGIDYNDLDNLRENFDEVSRLRATMSLNRRELVRKVNRRLQERWERRLAAQRQFLAATQALQRALQRSAQEAAQEAEERHAQWRYQMEQRLDEAFHEDNSRPQRHRRAPNRLNIVSNRGQSYQN